MIGAEGVLSYPKLDEPELDRQDKTSPMRGFFRSVRWSMSPPVPFGERRTLMESHAQQVLRVVFVEIESSSRGKP